MPLETTNNKRLYFLILVATLALVVTVAGCSTKKNYKLLSVFFDGVPNPDSQKIKDDDSKTRTSKEQVSNDKNNSQKNSANWVKIKSRHPDYFKNVCNNCHDRSSSNFLRVAKKEDLCFTCHRPEQFTGSFVHGPVAVKGCLICHQPHESPHIKLLRDEPNKLCAGCHIHDNQTAGITKIKALPDPKSACDKGKDCTTCHYGHAADNRFFLKNPPKVSSSRNPGKTGVNSRNKVGGNT